MHTKKFKRKKRRRRKPQLKESTMKLIRELMKNGGYANASGNKVIPKILRNVRSYKPLGWKNEIEFFVPLFLCTFTFIYYLFYIFYSLYNLVQKIFYCTNNVQKITIIKRYA